MQEQCPHRNRSTPVDEPPITGIMYGQVSGEHKCRHVLCAVTGDGAFSTDSNPELVASLDTRNEARTCSPR